MRDLVAVAVVVALVVFALSMATSLQWYRRSHSRLRRAVSARGQKIVAEIPVSEGLRFFTEDDDTFHWADRAIPKNEIRAARVLISGAPISTRVSARFESSSPLEAVDLEGPMDGIARDRWDVAIDLENETVLVECGAIRERVSQELARQVFDAVRLSIESRESELGHQSSSATPAR